MLLQSASELMWLYSHNMMGCHALLTENVHIQQWFWSSRTEILPEPLNFFTMLCTVDSGRHALINIIFQQHSHSVW